MWVFANQTTDAIVYRTGIARRQDGSMIPVAEADAMSRAQGKGLVLAELVWREATDPEIALIEAGSLGELTATIDNGQITTVAEEPVYTVELAANGGSDTVDIAADGVESCAVSITLKQPDGSAWDVNLAVLIPILVNGEAQHYQMTFAGGVATLTFMTTQSATYEVDGPAILQEFAGQRLTITGQAKVRAYL